MPGYIERRRRVLYARLDIPKDVRPKFGGKPRFVESLKTESQTEAERRAPLVIARWKAEIDRARTGKPSPYFPDAAQWAEWSQDYLKASPEQRATLDGIVSDMAEDMAWRDPEQAETFANVVTGKSVAMTEHLDAYIAGCKDVAKTLDERRATVLRFAKAFPFTHLVHRPKVKDWVHTLLTKDKLTPKTVVKKVSFLRGYWAYLQQEKVVDAEAEPFNGVVPKINRRAEAEEEDARQPFEAEDMDRLLRAAEGRKDHDLAHLIWLAMWTGCRIEELCSMRLTEVSPDRIKIVDAKTKASLRIVPLHTKLQPFVAALRERSNDGFLLSGLTFNKYGDRSNAIGKRFGRLRERLGFGPDLVFHSVRKTVATILENEGVPEGITADILGHKKQTMTYGLYSGGTSFERKAEAIATLDYLAAAPMLG